MKVAARWANVNAVWLEGSAPRRAERAPHRCAVSANIVGRRDRRAVSSDDSAASSPDSTTMNTRAASRSAGVRIDAPIRRCPRGRPGGRQGLADRRNVAASVDDDD